MKYEVEAVKYVKLATVRSITPLVGDRQSQSIMSMAAGHPVLRTSISIYSAPLIKTSPVINVYQSTVRHLSFSPRNPPFKRTGSLA